MKISPVGTKGRSAACAHGSVPADIHPILLLQQVQPAMLAAGVQQQQSSQEENGESICQEQKLQLLIGPLSFDLLTHFFQREDLEGPWGKSILGGRGKGSVRTSQSDDRVWAGTRMEKRSKPQHVIKSQTTGQERWVSNYNPLLPSYHAWARLGPPDYDSKNVDVVARGTFGFYFRDVLLKGWTICSKDCLVSEGSSQNFLKFFTDDPQARQ